MKRVSDIQKPLEEVICLLKKRIKMDLWMITRVIEDDWIIIAASQNDYGVKAGDVLKWSDSICSRMVQQEGPNIVSNVDVVDAYKVAPITQQKPISAYVGFPFVNENNEILGTLCAIDQNIKAEDLADTHKDIAPLLDIANTLINQNDTIFRLTNALDKLNEQNLVDDVTGLPNQEAFFELAAQAKLKYDALGCPIGVVIVDLGSFSLRRYNDGLQYEDVMRAVTSDLSSMLREADILCKLYGNRFCMLLLNVDTKYVSSTVMKMSKLLEPYKMNVSIGAEICREGTDIQTSIEHANDNKML
jgi:diguanylate cyclase (GGDEF)-like protein